MPGEAQRNRAPHPLTVAHVIEQLRTMPPHDLCCVSIPGGPDRCVTGAITTRGHTRLTTMPGWLPGTGAGTGVQRGGGASENAPPTSDCVVCPKCQAEQGTSDFVSYWGEEIEDECEKCGETLIVKENVSRTFIVSAKSPKQEDQPNHEKPTDDIRDSLDGQGIAY